MAFSTDLLHWTPGPTAAATSLMEYADSSHRCFARRGAGPHNTDYSPM